jgi:ATP-dependent RNA helicase DDX21
LFFLAAQAAATVRHLMLPAHWTQRVSLVTDLVACYGLGGRSIVFTETKNDANELAGSLSEVVGARCVVVVCWLPMLCETAEAG